ncbi:MAG TPA: hypothetical protein DF984_03455 [Anaerolineaceae bacterium]|nr:hypothetical protein [Anaerolineaceae bacterium]
MLNSIKTYLTPKKKIFFPAAMAAILIGMVLIWLGLQRTVTVVVDGNPQTVRTGALTSAGVLRAAGVKVDAADRVRPERNRLIWNQAAVTVESARDVVLKTPDYELVIPSAERIPANLLRAAEIVLFPQDQVRINGAMVDPNRPLEIEDSFVLQYVPAIPVTLVTDDDSRVIYTGQPTVGAAFEAAGIALGPLDWVSASMETAITEPLTITIRPARVITVQRGEETMTGLSAALTVGEALQEIGMPLQNLDSSKPEESAMVPDDGVIRVVRGLEELTILTDETAYETETREDPDTPLDQITVIQPGQPGIFASRQRVYYEDGEEVWRISEDSWQASVPQTAIVGMGTRVVIQTETIGGTTFNYYRKLTVYTTMYKPCDYEGNCWYYTSNRSPVQKGVIAVYYDWYYAYEGQQVYVTDYGYGVIADVCGGCVGMSVPWIDLGYSEDEYEAQHLGNGYRVMYFLAP